jgi:transposase-like protein
MPKPSVLTEAYFQDEGAAFDRLEAIIWPNGPVCPKCGCTGRIGSLKGVKDKKGRERLGLRKCYDCRQQFTVRVGTVFERSHVPLHVWFQAAYLLCSSKKGISSNQLSRSLGVTLQTAWFMSHRLREAMRVLKMEPLGGPGKHVEADETFIGHKKGFPRGVKGVATKFKVHSLVERGGPVRSTVLDSVTRQDVERIIRQNVHPESKLSTDTARYYAKSGFPVAEHGMVNHEAKEYVRGDVHVNTLEGYYSIFKRGMKGVYQHCAEKHLHRYLAEFDFRYNHRVRLGVGDVERTTYALAGIVGKRLTYRDSSAWPKSP